MSQGYVSSHRNVNLPRERLHTGIWDVVSRDVGIAPESKRVEAVCKFPQPHDVKTLRSFLGLASYYRRFIPQFSEVASPLHARTCKNTAFIWDSVCEEAFSRLKQLMTDAPVLISPRDASGVGLGAVLAQK